MALDTLEACRAERRATTRKKREASRDSYERALIHHMQSGAVVSHHRPDPDEPPHEPPRVKEPIPGVPQSTWRVHLLGNGDVWWSDGEVQAICFALAASERAHRAIAEAAAAAECEPVSA